jgi:Holliday junction resolvasome RuvABC endonuclease subunit
MKIIGIDASTNCTGIAVFCDGAYIEHTLIDLRKIKDSTERIPKMMVAICEYLDKHKVDKIIMEESVLKSNVAVVKMLAQLSGAIVFYAVKNGIEFEFALPTHWRKKVGLSQSTKIKTTIINAC